MAEAKRLGIRIRRRQVEAAYQRFASTNKMQLKQLDGVMDAVRRHQGAFQGIHPRPDGLEPGAERALSRRRRRRRRANRTWSGACSKRAAPSRAPPNTCCSRSSSSCRRPSAARHWPSASARPTPCAPASTAATRTREFAKGLIDVTVRDLGRVLGAATAAGLGRADQGHQGRRRHRACARPIAASSSSASARRAKSPTTRSPRWCSRAKAARRQERRRTLSKKYVEELRKKANIVER